MDQGWLPETETQVEGAGGWGHILSIFEESEKKITFSDLCMPLVATRPRWLCKFMLIRLGMGVSFRECNTKQEVPELDLLRPFIFLKWTRVVTKSSAYLKKTSNEFFFSNIFFSRAQENV